MNDGLDDLLRDLNPQQQAAVRHGREPLLIVAGAGTGKTTTLVHRVARLIAEGVDPRRILLLTFTRRASGEMIRRVDSVVARWRALKASTAAGFSTSATTRVWGGTFHAVAMQLLRMHGAAIGLEPHFTIHDRGDSEDLMDVARSDLDLGKQEKRFPRKSTCMAIYSRCINSRAKLDDVIEAGYTQFSEFIPQLKKLFVAYIDRKAQGAVVDYDDLLLFWLNLLEDEHEGDLVRKRFDYVLVDEYQDTNVLQSDVLKHLRPQGEGLTVVGDDAQSIYSFRAATVRNILDFPQEFPGALVLPLEQNYRSSQPLLDATNAVIAQARERHEKKLWTTRTVGERPQLVSCGDEEDQADFIVRTILDQYEAGVKLAKQAVLFRASHHAMLIEGELARRNIPFVKYGGLKFLETAHVKDYLSFLRLAENARDVVAGRRILCMIPGVGVKSAEKLLTALHESRDDFSVWLKDKKFGAVERMRALVNLLVGLKKRGDGELPKQLHDVRVFYSPLVEELYDDAFIRVRDVEQLELLGARFTDRSTLLAELTLDPPSSTMETSNEPPPDDALVLSTIHSAKGLEWDTVYVVNASDGNIPSEMSFHDDEQLEEERRLFYVALTRAINRLYVTFPMRAYISTRGMSDAYVGVRPTRFIEPKMKTLFEGKTSYRSAKPGPSAGGPRKSAREDMKKMWQ